MKNKFPFKILFVALALVMFSVMACKKSDSKPAPTKTDMLSRDWKLVDVLAGGVSVYGLLEACQKDDIYKFANNNTYQITEGATKCNTADPDIYDAGNWNFLENDTKLRLASAGGQSDTLTLQELTEASLKASSFVDVSGTPTEATLVFQPN